MKNYSPARFAAFEAVATFLQKGIYLNETLDRWSQKAHVATLDDHFARGIAYGTVQRMLTLEYLAQQKLDNKKLSLTSKAKALLLTALYQIVFMDRTPSYAVVHESVNIAKEELDARTAGFLNAILRRVSENIPSLPPNNLSIRHSYPQWFIDELFKTYSKDEVIQILESGNQPAVTIARKRKDNCTIVVEGNKVNEIAQSPDYYIQNRTPVELIKSLSTLTPEPRTILDLCAAPGGKMLLAHDLYQNAKLFANDPSSERLERLASNIKKYGLDVSLSQQSGETFHSSQGYDLIILDVPCSNSGVLNKRPEARWRLTQESVQALTMQQTQLLKHALQLLNPGGLIWYMTCSILPCENEQIVKDYHLLASRKILPDLTGNDGGFACAIRKN